MLDSSWSYPIKLGEAVGVELEYMIVDADTFDVKPIADELIKSIAGEYVSDVEPEGADGIIGWSNELALHVIELKTIDPVRSLDGLAERFQRNVEHVQRLLEPMNARLLPTAMHPWMDPHREMKLWPHEYSPVYEAFDRIFSCEGHGWANLQSTHINLPFGNDEEFGRLHAALRLILPLLPGLAASSPMMDGRISGFADTRLEVYRTNARRVPSVSGSVVPEPVFTRSAYETELLERIYADIAPLDPEGILRHEWLNARGLIARFGRGSIEIRVLDIQEAPIADLAIVELITSVADGMTNERWTTLDEQKRWDVKPLSDLFLQSLHDGERTVVNDPAYLRLFGIDADRATISEIWRELANETLVPGGASRRAIDVILDEGTLSTRMRRALGDAPDRERARSVYGELAACLTEGRMFRVPPGV